MGRFDSHERRQLWRVLVTSFAILAGVGVLKLLHSYRPKAGVTDVLKSPLDDREFSSFVLPNGLRVMAVSDPSASKSAAAVDCAVGSNHDPSSSEGLAHLLEHLAFMGSRMHPNENGFLKFLSENGGSANAKTSSEHTNYYFEVNPQRLTQAMSMLAYALHDPLLSHSAIAREVQAVDAEYSKNVQSDQWRLMQLLRRSSHPMHPFSRIGVGNYDTLLGHWKKSSRDPTEQLSRALRTFHNQHYRAANMRLAVVGPQSLGELCQMVMSAFSLLSAAPAHPTPAVHFRTPFRALGQRIDFVPVRDSHLLQIVWPVEPQRALYAAKPAAYISHLLGHEANHTLASYLMGAGLAEGLTAGPGVELTSFSTFKLVVRLTPLGFANVNRVMGVVFDYIARVHEAGVQKWVYDEVAELAKLRFHYSLKAAVGEFVSALANNLHYYPAADVLRAPSLLWRWSEEHVERLLGSLSVANALVFVGSSSYAKPIDPTQFVFDKRIGTSVRQGVVSPDRGALGDSLIKPFRLPDANPYLPVDLRKLEASEGPTGHLYGDTPKLIQHRGWTKLWHMPSRLPGSPKAVVYIHLMTPLVLGIGPREAVMSQLAQLLWEDSVKQMLYPAKLAGVNFNVGTSTSGLVLQASGFAHRLPEVVEKALAAMLAIKIDEHGVALHRQKLLGVYGTVQRSQPLWYAQYLLKQLLRRHAWPHHALEHELKSVTSAEMDAFIKRLVSRFHSEALVYGALSPTDAVQLMRKVERAIGWVQLPVTSVPIQRAAQLKGSAMLAVTNPNPSDVNSAVTKYIELGDDTPRGRVLLQMLSNMAQQSFFAQLRSREQLGYSVSCTGSAQFGKLGLLAQVQSRKFNATFISARIDRWYASFEATLRTISRSAFDVQLDVVRQQLGGLHGSESAHAERLWREIREHEFNFDRRAEQLKAASTLEVADLLQMLHVDDGAELHSRTTGAQMLRMVLNHLEVRVEADPDGGGGISNKSNHHSEPVRSRVLELRRTKASWPAYLRLPSTQGASKLLMCVASSAPELPHRSGSEHSRALLLPKVPVASSVPSLAWNTSALHRRNATRMVMAEDYSDLDDRHMRLRVSVGISRIGHRIASAAAA